MSNEADTCRRFVVPKLQAAGWDNDPFRINEQVTFTDGRIVVTGQRGRRRPGKRADYILRYRPDFPIAVVEAKASYATAGEGLQLAKDYAVVLGLSFAFSTNGHEIIEFDFTTGIERQINSFHAPAELWARLNRDQYLDPAKTDKLLTPAYHLSGKSPADALVHLPLEQLADDILAKERRIIEIMEEIKAELAAGGKK